MTDIKVEKSSGNVFKDIGMPDPTSELIRAEVALEIFKAMKQKKMTQVNAAKLLGIKQPDVSKLKNGNFSHFSLERLLTFLNKLGKTVELRIASARNRKPVQRVVSA